MNDELLLHVDGPIATITFNRPEARNAMTEMMVQRMISMLKNVAADDRVRCLVLEGAGEHFMGGGDVAGFSTVLAEAPDERRDRFAKRIIKSGPLFRQLLDMPKAVVASVRGACAGAAVGIVSLCDFVIAGESAFFLVPQVRLGASPDCAISYALPRRIGSAKALQMAILGSRMDAGEAERCGLAYRVVPDDNVNEVGRELAERLASLPALSVRTIKQLLNRSPASTLDEQLALEAEGFARCAATDDFVEGVSSFLEKRSPNFNRT